MQFDSQNYNAVLAVHPLGIKTPTETNATKSNLAWRVGSKLWYNGRKLET